MIGYRGFYWLAGKSPAGFWHFIGSRIVVGRVGQRKTVMFTSWRFKWYRSFGWGKRP